MIRLLLSVLIAAWSSMAVALPLSTMGSFAELSREFQANTLKCALVARGSGTNVMYAVEVDTATGAVGGGAAATTGRTFSASVHNNYATTNVTTGAWVQLIASTTATINDLYIFDSCGEVLELGTGAAAAESRVALIPPGGIESPFALRIATGTRLSVRAVSASCTSGRLVITGLN